MIKKLLDELVLNSGFGGSVGEGSEISGGTNSGIGDKAKYTEGIVNALFELDEAVVNVYQKTAIITALSANINNKINATLLSTLVMRVFANSTEPPLIKDAMQNAAQNNKITIDVCGTGGDGQNTLNVSTAVAFLLAFSDKFCVVKHGNFGVSSLSGSANIFELCGLKTNPEIQAEYLNHYSMCFLLAPLYNKALANFAKIRKDLGIRTIFNLLGPLLNPTKPQMQLIGTFTKDLQGYANAAKISGSKHFAAVQSNDGCDEISAIHQTSICYFDGNKFNNFTIHPLDFGITQKHNKDSILGKSPEYNYNKMASLFCKKQYNASLDCFRDFVIANAAFCFYMAKCGDLKTCYKLGYEIHQKILKDDLFATMINNVKNHNAKANL